MISSVNLIRGQSNYDISLKTYGGLDNLIKLLKDSGSTSTSQVVSVYKFDTNKISNKLLTGINYATQKYQGTPLLNNDGTILRDNNGNILYNNF